MRFRTKIMICMVCILSLLFGIGGSLLITTSFDQSMEREREKALQTYQMVLGVLQLVQSVGESPADALDQLTQQSSGAWAALRLSDQESGAVTYENGVKLPDQTPEAPQQDECVFSLVEDGAGETYLQLSGVVMVEDQLQQLDMGFTVSSLYAVRQTQKTSFQVVFLVMAVLCMAFSYGSAWLLTLPLGRLSRAYRKIEDGNLSYRISASSDDEIGSMVADFNQMADALEQNIRALELSVEQQQRFVGSFAHELKTPMTSIVGYADLLRGQTLTRSEQQEAANYIFSEGKRLEALSRKLLDILVLDQEITPQPVNLARLMQKTAAQLKPIYQAQGIRLRWRCGAGQCLLEPDLIQSLLLNLLDNARKAMDGGGTILLLGRILPDGCQICVQDDGRGIPQESLQHLTEVFYRVDKSRSRSQGGVGLGLTLCQKIVALHGGQMRFESQIGVGSRVTVELKGGRHEA